MKRPAAVLVLLPPVALAAFILYARLLGPRLPTEGIPLHSVALGTIIIGVVAAPAMAAMVLVWMAVETELVSGRAERRVGRGLCPACGYPSQGRGRVCPECGARSVMPPARDAVKRGAMRRATAAVVAGFLVGCIAGEAAGVLDGRAFGREAAAFRQGGGMGQYWRPCWWPRESWSMHFTAPERYWVND